ncbi:MAG TPA: plastocyanin/azurin family copper-binding protein [Ktedonobacteraceae bacterium]|nr:plastocyanin/azurin family copper-binding protein [Ktedonobacteraceae bacterium]
MSTPSIKTQRFTRMPVAVLGKVSAVSLLVMAVLCGVIATFSQVLLVIAGVLLLSAVLIMLGLRWAPALGSVISAFVLYTFLVQTAYPVYHLAHPKDSLSNPLASFVMFIVIALIIWCALLALGAGISATLQNYRGSARQRPRWFTAALTGMVGLLIGAILIAAMAQPAAASAASATTNGVPTVHMGMSTFDQTSITIAKGSKLLLVDDNSIPHVLANGSWVNGQPQTENQAGEPLLNNVTVNGNSLAIGPFTIAGTYHIYCRIHPGMMLTVIVQ